MSKEQLKDNSKGKNSQPALQEEKKEAEKEVSCEALLKQKEREYNELWDKYLRACADFENTRKRLERQTAEAIKFANESLIKELLNILDDLERTLSLAQNEHKDLAIFLKGIEMVLAHLYELLKKYGLKPIEAEGKIFDPHYHEVLLQVEDDTIPEHTVVEELQKGYLLNDKVIRTAKVKASKKKEKKEQDSGNQT